jgi:hypothetical protein
MGMATVLYNQTAIFTAIKRLFSSSKVRRVAIAAFVGDAAESYLPSPTGIELVCWPRAGGTNPRALRSLMGRGVDVWVADRLHMKVYWAEGRGCVIASANLSANALGAGNLKEAGVFVSSDFVDIDRLLISLKRRRGAEPELRKLDRAHTRFISRNRLPTESTHPSFLEWLTMPMRPNWKLGWADSDGVASIAAKERTKQEFGIAEPSYFLAAAPGHYTRSGGDWILVFNLAQDSPTQLRWMFSDYVVDVAPKDKKAYCKEYPCHAVQAWPVHRYPGRPFLLDEALRRAFRKALKEYGADKVRSAASMTPPAKLVELIGEHFRE